MYKEQNTQITHLSYKKLSDSFVIYKNAVLDASPSKVLSTNIQKKKSFYYMKIQPMGVRILYPSDWEIQNLPQSSEDIFSDTQIAFISPRESTLDIFRELLSIGIGSLPELGSNDTLSDILQQFSYSKLLI